MVLLIGNQWTASQPVLRDYRLGCAAAASQLMVISHIWIFSCFMTLLLISLLTRSHFVFQVWYLWFEFVNLFSWHMFSYPYIHCTCSNTIKMAKDSNQIYGANNEDGSITHQYMTKAKTAVLVKHKMETDWQVLRRSSWKMKLSDGMITQ